MDDVKNTAMYPVMSKRAQAHAMVERWQAKYGEKNKRDSILRDKEWKRLREQGWSKEAIADEIMLF